MSVQKLERQIRALPPADLARLGQWFDDYRETLPPETQDDWEDDLTDEQREEILRRRAAYLADPSIAEPWEGTTERLREQLRAYRRQKD